MKMKKRDALQKLKEQGLRERFLSLKKIFEEESKDQAETELQFKNEIEREEDKLQVLNREIKILDTRITCFKDENEDIEREIEKTQRMLDDICREIQVEGTEWRNELQSLKFQVVEQEHENKRRKNLVEEQDSGLFKDIERSLKQQQKAQHAQVMGAYREMGKMQTERNQEIKREIRQESRKLLKQLELEREGEARMKRGMMDKDQHHQEVLMKADHEIGLVRDEIRKNITGIMHKEII
jgi:hypothetical protein